MEARIWKAEEIKQNLQTSDVWLFKGITAIYRFQTDQEKNAEHTIEDNGVGFNAVDSTILSSFAEQIIQWNEAPVKRFRSPLSDRQVVIARKAMLKYAKQLAKIANKEIRA